jgi:LPXTG-motif cell wall-anchored protein
LVDNGTGSFVPAVHVDGTPVISTTTDSNGRYVFDNLPTGTYVVRFTHNQNGYRWTDPNGGPDATDSDVVFTSNAAATSQTHPFVLAIGEPNVAAVSAADVADLGALTAVQIDRTRDAGIWVPFAVGNYVWFDVNQDGRQDAAEEPVGGVAVELLNPDGSAALDADGSAVVATITDASGHYLFDNLPPGSFMVRFSNLPAGYKFTTPSIGEPTGDSNAGTDGVTEIFTVGPTSPNMRPPVAADGTTHMVNPTIDAGISKIVVSGGGQLPVTGTSPVSLLIVGALLVLVGAALFGSHRGRPARQTLR